MNKRVEFSEDLKIWKVFVLWKEAEARDKWAALQEWIQQTHPYGFFRMVDDI